MHNRHRRDYDDEGSCSDVNITTRVAQTRNVLVCESIPEAWVIYVQVRLIIEDG